MAKPKPASNVTQFPRADDSETEINHDELAAQLKPDDLNDEEGKIWDLIAAELSKHGRLKALFVHTIQSYCEVFCRLKKLRKQLDEDEWTYVTKGRHGEQIKSRPEVAQLNDDWRKFRALISELGLSPSAEKGLQGVQGELFGADPWGDI